MKVEISRLIKILLDQDDKIAWLTFRNYSGRFSFKGELSSKRCQLPTSGCRGPLIPSQRGICTGENTTSTWKTKTPGNRGVENPAVCRQPPIRGGGGREPSATNSGHIYRYMFARVEMRHVIPNIQAQSVMESFGLHDEGITEQNNNDDDIRRNPGQNCVCFPPLRRRPNDVSLSFCSFVVSSRMPPPAASPLLDRGSDHYPRRLGAWGRVTTVLVPNPPAKVSASSEGCKHIVVTR